MIRRVPRPVSREMVNFHRREQMQRLADFVAGKTLRRPHKLQKTA
jgi:hypothetical protein